MSFETSGSLTTATKTADGTAVEITTDATVPTDTSISLTVNQDESGGTTADNTETIPVADGTNTTSLSNFNNVTGSSWWLTINLSTSDNTVSPTFNSATLTVEQSVTIGASPVELSFAAQDAFASAQTLVSADPVTLGLDTPTPFVAAELPPLRADPVKLDLTVSNAFIAPFLLADEWQVGRERVRPSTIEASAETLSLSFTVERENIDRWREYDRAGDIATETGFGGAFRAFGRGDGDGDTEVRPSFKRMRPFRPSTDYRVAGYAEEQVAPDRFEVTLDLQRARNRGEAFPALSQTGAFEIALSHGTIGLSERQVGQIDRDGAPAGAEVSLEVRVSDEQAGALLDNLGYPDGVVARSVPDGPDQRVDETGGRQTVTLSTPADAAIADGDWFVTDWTLSFNSYSAEREWALELALAES